MPAADEDVVGVHPALVLPDEGGVAHDQAPQTSEVCVEQSVK